MIKNRITTILLNEIDRDYIKQYKNILENCIYSDKFQLDLDSYIKDRDFSVFSLYTLFYKLLYPIHENSKDKWFEDVYKWALSKSFPDKYQLDFNLDGEYIYKFYLNAISSATLSLEEIKETPFISKHPISFLDLEEEKQLNFSHEYFNFKSKFKELFIYEIM